MSVNRARYRHVGLGDAARERALDRPRSGSASLRHNTFPGEVFMGLAADALDTAGVERNTDLDCRARQSAHLPDVEFRGTENSLQERAGRENRVVEFLDPRGVPSRAIEPYALSAHLAEGETVALFANGFPDSVAFLDHVEQSLSRELPGVRFVRLEKGNASALATDAQLSQIADTCSAVVAAYGH